MESFEFCIVPAEGLTEVVQLQQRIQSIRHFVNSLKDFLRQNTYWEGVFESSNSVQLVLGFLRRNIQLISFKPSYTRE
jgi:hypothetical protein